MASEPSQKSLEQSHSDLNDSFDELLEYSRPVIDDHGVSRGNKRVVLSSEDSDDLNDALRRESVHEASSSHRPVQVSSLEESLHDQGSQDSQNPCVSGLNQSVCVGDDIGVVHHDDGNVGQSVQPPVC